MVGSGVGSSSATAQRAMEARMLSGFDVLGAMKLAAQVNALRDDWRHAVATQAKSILLFRGRGDSATCTGCSGRHRRRQSRQRLHPHDGCSRPACRANRRRFDEVNKANEHKLSIRRNNVTNRR